MRAIIFAAGLLAACGGGAPPSSGAAVGSPCVDPSGGSALGPELSSPALECESRLCLIVPAASARIVECTAPCGQDSDCAAAANSACAGGFTCLAPLATGAARWQKLCVCRDTGLAPATGC